MLIYSDNLKEHRKHVRKVLEQLRDAGLFLKPSKCEFHMQEVEFLGFVIGINGVRMDPAKVESVTAWPTARSPHDYRHLFEGLGQQITIYLDHYNLLWFTETKVYNRRQARWAEKLAKYDFVIHFHLGTQAGKPDALSRRPDYIAENKVMQPMPFLRPEQVDTTGLEIGAQEQLRDGDLERAIREAQERDTITNKETMKQTDGLWLKDGRIYVPADTEIKLRILEEHHDRKTASHLGQDKTLELIAQDYTWPGMREFVNEYVRRCDTCTRNKTPRHCHHGQLYSLPIPNSPWKSVSMDFVVQLPPSQGYDAIYMYVDRFTKMAHFIATTTGVTAEGTADLYLRHIFKNHGLPEDIISDRGIQFVAKFTRQLLELIEVKGNRSTAS